jgi:sulfur-oxidizing protein SoxZ
MPSRLQVPPRARRGERVEVRIVIQHPMENGQRRDAEGRTVPYNALQEMFCRYAGEEVFRMYLSSGFAANPVLDFHLVASRSGEIELHWVDTEGETGSASARIAVDD